MLGPDLLDSLQMKILEPTEDLSRNYVKTSEQLTCIEIWIPPDLFTGLHSSQDLSTEEHSH